jgi:hypothetical protein
VSSLLADAEAAIAYAAPPELPVRVLSVGYGQAAATPDLVDIVEVAWQHVARPGMFTVAVGKSGDWQGSLDAQLRLRVYEIESIYALLGGWPAATPLPTEYEPPPGVAYVPDLPPGYILPPGVIGIG